MRRFWIVPVLLAAVIAPGCSTMTKTPSERAHTYRRIDDIERRQFAEDFDAAFLQDHPSRLTQWQTR